MEAINKIAIIFTLMFTGTFVFSQTDQTSKDIKFKLTEYLLSCQSTYFTILEAPDIETRYYLADVGYNYYNKANKEWIALQNPEYGTIDEKLQESISTLMWSYEKIFREKDVLQEPTTAIGVTLLGKILRDVFLPGLWGK